jgi:arylsulfatase A-like enzyme
LLDHLAELGLEDNTFVVFTSDNGPWYEGSSAVLRGRKGDTAYDGGYRVPFVAWAPGRIAAGSSTAAIISGMDMLPTLCALAGVAPPAGVTIDGRDISGVLLDGMDSPHDAILLFNNEDVVGVRTQRWKYVSHTYYRGLWVNMERQGYPQLYDMSRDAPENYSVADRHPDILADMQTRVRDARETFAPYKKGMPPFIRELINTGRFRAQD